MNKSISLSSNIVFSVIKTISNIILPLITYPYVSRILGVDNMGKFAFSQSIISYFVLLASFGINAYATREGSILLSKKNKLNFLINQMFTINILFSCGAFLLLLIFILVPSPVSSYRFFLIIQASSVLVAPLALDWFYAIYEDFKYITLRGLLFQALTLVAIFIFVKDENDIYLYIGIISLGTVISNIISYLYSRKYEKIKLIKQIELKKHIRPLLVFFLNSITSIIYISSDVTILGLLSGNYATGLYSVATKIYNIAKQIFGAIIVAIIPRLAFCKENNLTEFEKLSGRIIRLVYLISIPMSFGMILLRNEIILIISGKDYIEAVKPLAILSFAIIFAALANIIANGVLICLGREKMVVRSTLICASENIILNLILIPCLSERGAAVTTLVAEITMLFLSVFYSKDFLKKIINKKIIYVYLSFGLIMYFIAGIVRFLLLNCNLYFRSFMVVFIGGIVYIFCLYIFKDDELFFILGEINKRLKRKSYK